MLLLAWLIVPFRSECESDTTILVWNSAVLVPLFAFGLHADSSDEGLLCRLIRMNASNTEITCSDVQEAGGRNNRRRRYHTEKPKTAAIAPHKTIKLDPQHL